MMATLYHFLLLLLTYAAEIELHARNFIFFTDKPKVTTFCYFTQPGNFLRICGKYN